VNTLNSPRQSNRQIRHIFAEAVKIPLKSFVFDQHRGYPLAPLPLAHFSGHAFSRNHFHISKLSQISNFRLIFSTSASPCMRVGYDARPAPGTWHLGPTAWHLAPIAPFSRYAISGNPVFLCCRRTQVLTRAPLPAREVSSLETLFSLCSCGVARKRQSLSQSSREAVGRTAGAEAVGRTAGAEAIGRTAGAEAVGRTAGAEAVGRTAGAEAVGRAAGAHSV
jgi:hypothetical protein